MTLDEFFRGIEAENAAVPGKHLLEPGLTRGQLKAWRDAHPGVELPKAYLDLLRRSNGMRLNVDPYFDADGLIRLLPLDELDLLPRRLHDTREHDAEFPPDWFVISLDGNNDRYIVLDAGHYQFLDIDLMSPDDPTLVMDGVEPLLEWLAHHYFLANLAPPGGPPPAGRLAEVRRFAGYQTRVTCVALSPDGTKAAAGATFPEDRPLRVWNVASGRLAWAPRDVKEVVALAFSPDGRRLLSGAYDNTLQLWDVGRRRLLRAWDVKARDDRDHWSGRAGNGLAFTPDGAGVVANHADFSVRLWDADSGEELRRFAGHEKYVSCLAVSPDGAVLASGGWDKTIRFWDLGGGPDAKPGRVVRLQFPVMSMAFSPDGSRLLTGGNTTADLRVWDVASGAEVLRLTGHQTMDVLSVAFAADGRRAVSGGGGRDGAGVGPGRPGGRWPAGWPATRRPTTNTTTPSG